MRDNLQKKRSSKAFGLDPFDKKDIVRTNGQTLMGPETSIYSSSNISL